MVLYKHICMCPYVCVYMFTKYYTERVLSVYSRIDNKIIVNGRSFQFD